MEFIDAHFGTGAPEIRERLEIYRSLLLKWQPRINLVGSGTLDDLWRRHFVDSLQLLKYAGAWKQWVDLGSGGGFPGLVIAISQNESEPGSSVHLIELDKRKAAFLRDVSRETGASAEVHVGRIEQVLPDLADKVDFDIVSARALASFSKLLEYSWPVLKKGGLGLFLKGKGLEAELTEAHHNYSVNCKLEDSLTEFGARIVIVQRCGESSIPDWSAKNGKSGSAARPRSG